METDLSWFVWVILLVGVTILIALIYSIVRCCAVSIEPSPIVQRYLFFRQSERGTTNNIPPGRSRLVSVCEIYPHSLRSSMFGPMDEKPVPGAVRVLQTRRMPTNVVILCPNTLRSAPSYLDAPPPAYETVVPVDSIKTRGLHNV